MYLSYITKTSVHTESFCRFGIIVGLSSKLHCHCLLTLMHQAAPSVFVSQEASVGQAEDCSKSCFHSLKDQKL